MYSRTRAPSPVHTILCAFKYLFLFELVTICCVSLHIYRNTFSILACRVQLSHFPYLILCASRRKYVNLNGKCALVRIWWHGVRVLRCDSPILESNLSHNFRGEIFEKFSHTMQKMRVNWRHCFRHTENVSFDVTLGGRKIHFIFASSCSAANLI